jgi:hypothetical protein
MAQTETRVFTAHVLLPLADKVDQLAARLGRSRAFSFFGRVMSSMGLSMWIPYFVSGAQGAGLA